jgi:Tol biopolymer transport system component
MGEVWRARDTRLDRSVAIKILPAELAANAQFRLRFEREARLISQLNHPHICSLYDVGDAYLVMELVEGESLADRLARGALPIEEALRYGAQVADALDRAHRAGIIHRDLKPGNIMITKSGAKLLDFGLAKSAAVMPDANHATELKPLTQEGTIVGTFQYMAPEQLEGAEADARTDLFAFGAVLYEMATGKRAFEGKTRTSLIAAIVAGQPKPISELQPLTPPALEHVIVKCLSKDPDDRWQSAHDVAEELRWIGSAGSRAGVPSVAASKKKTRERIAWIAALLAALAIAAWLALRPRPPERVLEAELAPGDNAGLDYLSGPPAFSPDGKLLAYAAAGANGRRTLWIRSLEHGNAHALAGTGDVFSPFWSPDGRYIAYGSTGGALMRVAVAGGPSETIVKSTNGGWGWNRAGVILFVGSVVADIRRISASGGEPKVVLEPKAIGSAVLYWPFFLPDGNHYLVTALGGVLVPRSQEGVWVATLDNSEKPRFLIRADANAVYVEPGYLLFTRQGVLRAQRFDARGLRVIGEPRSIAPVQSYEWAAHFSASNSGMLVYQPPGNVQLSQLAVMNRKGEVLRKLGAPGFYWVPRVSADGGRIAVDLTRDAGDIWVFDAGDGAGLAFSFEPRNETSALWSPRGDELLYMMNPPAGGAALIRKSFGGAARTLLEDINGFNPTDWSADERHVAMNRLGERTDVDVAVWSLEQRKWTSVSSTPATEANGVFSADGKWIVYQSNESGRVEIYVQPFPPTGAKYQVTTAGGMTPRWSRRGEIFWVDPENRLNVAAVVTGKDFRAAAPAVLFPIRQPDNITPQYDVMPDSNLLVNALVPSQPKPMTLVVNWWRRFEQ